MSSVVGRTPDAPRRTTRPTLDDIERQLAQYRADLGRGFELRMSAVEKVLLEMEARGHRYFDDTLRLGRVFDLVNRSRVQREFEQQVVGRRPAADRAARLGDHRLAGRPGLSPVAGGVDAARDPSAGARRSDPRRRPTSAASTRIASRLLESVGREAQRVVETYDRRRESEAIANGARTAVAATAAVGAGALGLGALVSLAATTAAADITGLRHGRRHGRAGVPDHPGEAPQGEGRDPRQGLVAHQRPSRRRSAPSSRAPRNVSAQRFADAMGPYTRFVRAERERWDSHRSSLTTLREPHQPAAVVAPVRYLSLWISLRRTGCCP